MQRGLYHSRDRLFHYVRDGHAPRHGYVDVRRHAHAGDCAYCHRHAGVDVRALQAWMFMAVSVRLMMVVAGAYAPYHLQNVRMLMRT